MTENVAESDDSDSDILFMVSAAFNLGAGVAVASYSLTA